MQRLHRFIPANAGVHHFMAVGQIALAVVGQRYFSRRAIQQPDVEILLKSTNSLADTRLCHTQFSGGFGKRTVFYEKRKKRHILNVLEHNVTLMYDSAKLYGGGMALYIPDCLIKKTELFNYSRSQNNILQI